MGGKAEYKSAIRSRKMIRQAFLELLKEKEVDKITVTDIVKRADINRGTFYAHYQSTESVITQIENEIIGKMFEFLSELHYKNILQDPLPLLLKVARYLEENSEYYRILITAKGSDQFIAKLKSIFVEYLENDEEIPSVRRKSPEFMLRAQFIAGGIVNLYQGWFSGEIQQPLSEISLVISKIIVGSERE